MTSTFKRLLAVLLMLSLMAVAACSSPVAPADTGTSGDEAATEVEGTEAEGTEAEEAEGGEIESSEEVSPADDMEEPESTDEGDGEEESTDPEADSEEDEQDSQASGTLMKFSIVPEESEVTYEVDEVFFKEGNKLVTAVGRTQEIKGDITVDPTTPQSLEVGTVEVDISTFKSDSDRRDKAIRDKWLESATYPMATFEPTSIEGLPETYEEGDEVSFEITGDLTVRETTSEATFDVDGTVEDDQIIGTATTLIQMTDFDFEPPDIAGILRAENDTKLTFTFLAESTGEVEADAEEEDAEEEVADDEIREPEGNVEDFWNEFFWEDMTTAEQEQWEILGWDEESWDEETSIPESDELFWEELTDEEQEAVAALGYDEESWDATLEEMDDEE